MVAVSIPGRVRSRIRLRLASIDDLQYAIAVTVAVALGVVVRAAPVLTNSFPLNDGGLFFEMVRDLQGNSYRIPSVTSYNAESIPFAYPPLGFYLAALVDDLTPLSLIETFRWLPLVISCFTLLAVYRLASRLLDSRVAVVAAVVAFALIPRSFIWLVMGGGLTRSLGVLFAILALEQLHRLITEGGRRPMLLTALWAAATLMSHLEAAWLLMFSGPLFWLAFSPTRGSLFRAATAAAGAVLLALPWLLSVLAAHGLDPFLNANRTGGNVIQDAGSRESALNAILDGVATSEPYFPVIGALGLLGAFICLSRGQWLLPAWFVAIILLDSRAFATYSAIPVALMAGVAVARVILPVALGHQPEPQAARARNRGQLVSARPLGLLTLVALLSFATFASMSTRGNTAEVSVLTSLRPAHLEATDWVEANTPADSRFLVVPTDAWQIDRLGEWFPALADRRSVATVQGSEWLPNHEFNRRIEWHARASWCAYQGRSCLSGWTNGSGADFDYVVLPVFPDGSSCCSTLLNSLRATKTYEEVYEGDGAHIFRYLGPLTSAIQD